MARTSDRELLRQTNKLARKFYSMMGCQVSAKFKFYQDNNGRPLHPQEKLCWLLACEAQLQLKDTIIEDLNYLWID